jgi:hypothetical protein
MAGSACRFMGFGFKFWLLGTPISDIKGLFWGWDEGQQEHERLGGVAAAHRTTGARAEGGSAGRVAGGVGADTNGDSAGAGAFSGCAGVGRRGAEKTSGDGGSVSLPVDIAGDLDAVAFARERLGFEPDEKQAELLATTAQQVILNCTRQWGKSTVSAARAVYEAWSKPGSLTLVVSPSERQSGEFVRKARTFAARIESKVRGDGQNRCSVMLANGSRIVGVPSRDTIRGFSAVSLLLVDEASRVVDELYYAVQPMLAVSNGATWLLSTPLGKRGFFWEEWAKGGADWKRVSVPATECLRIPAAFLARQRRRAWSEDWFRQEYMCCFVDSDECVFPRELVERAFTDKVRPLFS